MTDSLKIIREFMTRHTSSNVDRMSIDDMHSEIDRLVGDEECARLTAERDEVRMRLEQISAAHTAAVRLTMDLKEQLRTRGADLLLANAECERLRAALKWAIDALDTQICTHEETHRGGAIWTICDSCGKKWADDKGGFKPYKEPPELTAARNAINAARKATPCP